MPSYVLITESALDRALIANRFQDADGLPATGHGVHLVTSRPDIFGFRVYSEINPTFFAAVNIDCVRKLLDAGGSSADIFQRIARVVKGLKAPPVHLPRHWSEYHHRNLLAFFALPRDVSSLRWVVELDGSNRIALFDAITSDEVAIDLSRFNPPDRQIDFPSTAQHLIGAQIQADPKDEPQSLATEFDLRTIGSGSIVADRTYEDWQRYLNQPQQQILNSPIDTSIRIVGPAGSGKTLSLCLRAMQIARDPRVLAGGQRVLVATHSWAMAERIDGILSVLNGGVAPHGITVFPLLSLLELHAGHIGHRRTEVLGVDSTEGRVRTLELIAKIVATLESAQFPLISTVLRDGLVSKDDSRRRIDLVLNLYEEITGVIGASGVAPDDSASQQDYLNSDREDWMPPFQSFHDRAFAFEVYQRFMQALIDRSAITTDQFVLDAIRVLETFTWRIKKETEGYDFVVIDELQLFDPQERSSLELLGRSRKSVPFITAEDPSQGVFAALNSRRAIVHNAPVYFDTVHRFNRPIFDFVSFLYQKFPLNAVPLRIANSTAKGSARPELFSCGTNESAVAKVADLVGAFAEGISDTQRVCVITLGDVNDTLIQALERKSGIVVSRLESFDDIEQLSYRKKSIVVSPWQFIGGTQFSHVIVLALGMEDQQSRFGRLREMTSIYLACSRATDILAVVSAGYTPAILNDAAQLGLLSRGVVHSSPPPTRTPSALPPSSARS